MGICGVVLLLQALGPVFFGDSSDATILQISWLVSSAVSLGMVFDITPYHEEERQAQIDQRRRVNTSSPRSRHDWQEAARYVFKIYALPLNVTLVALSLLVTWQHSSQALPFSSLAARAAPCLGKLASKRAFRQHADVTYSWICRGARSEV